MGRGGAAAQAHAWLRPSPHASRPSASLPPAAAQVRIAQQSSDDVCLAHALAALCQLLDATTPGTITSISQSPGASPAARHYSQLGQLLRRCLRRSEELQLPHLVAFTHLALARFELLHPMQPPAVAESAGEGSSGTAAAAAGEPPCSSSVAVAGAARDVAHLHLAARLAAAVPVAPAPAADTTGAMVYSCSARVLQGVGDLFTSAAPLFSPRLQGAWEHAGAASTRRLYAAAATEPLHVPAAACRAGSQTASAAEVERLAGGAHLLQAASWELRGSRHLSQAHALCCLDSFGDVARAEDQCTALAQLATSVAASHGYAAAEQLLAAADERFPHSQSPVLAGARLAIAHERALHRGDIHAAMDLAAQMVALASPTDSTDIMLR